MANGHSVAIIGAGPAGLYAAKTLSDAGVEVVLLNRDIKPGGLAEYGIYHNKHRMKEGLRKQFRKVLASDDVHYFGNVRIGKDSDLSLDDVRTLGFDAVLIAAGAQGTKWLGLPGEDLTGVYHAKDVVYHYNKLPPFSERDFHFGDHIAIIGVGNVMVDIAHYGIRSLKVSQVTAFARRGPEERKYTDKEAEHVIANWDLDATKAELERIRSRIEATGGDIDAIYEDLTVALKKAEAKESDTCMVIQWLSSPAAILGDDDGKVRALVVDDTEIYEDKGRMRVRTLGTQREIPCSSVVFAIGDTVDVNLGLPLNKWGEFAISETPLFPVSDTSYEIDGIPATFACGWSREASTGLVGAARKDGTHAANAVLSFLDGRDSHDAPTVDAVKQALAALPHPVVDKAGWETLEAIEAKRAESEDLPLFKFDSNADMLKAIGI